MEMRIIASATLGLLVAGCAAVPPSGERMAGDAFIALVRGNTMDGRGTDGSVLRTYVTPELAQRGSARPPGGAERRYSGTIRTAEHGFCSQSPDLRGGQERCFDVWRDGTTLQTYWNGSVWTTMTIQPGNPYGL